MQPGNHFESGLNALVMGTDWRDISHKPHCLHVWWTSGWCLMTVKKNSLQRRKATVRIIFKMHGCFIFIFSPLGHINVAPVRKWLLFSQKKAGATTWHRKDSDIWKCWNRFMFFLFKAAETDIPETTLPERKQSYCNNLSYTMHVTHIVYHSNDDYADIWQKEHQYRHRTTHLFCVLKPGSILAVAQTFSLLVKFICTNLVFLLLVEHNRLYYL